MIDFDYVLMLSQRDTDIAQHLFHLYSAAIEINAKTVVEIGAGQSTYVLTAAVNKTGGEFYSIDLSEDSRLRLFPEGKGVLDKEKRYHFIEGNSVIDEPQRLSVITNWHREIDLLFIDSGHTYDLTLKELNLWTKWVRKGGIICMHDTSRSWVDCRKALEDFLTNNKDQFVRYQYENQNGFTILRKL